MVDTSSAGSKEAAIQEITAVVRALQHGLGGGLVAVVLYGSRARCEAKEEIDWDLLVIAQGLPKRHIERCRMVKDVLPPEWRGKISLLAKTPKEFEAVLPSLYLEIALDGLILHDPQGYATAQLQKLLWLVISKGLRREKHGENLVWQWESFPGFGWSLAWEEAA